MVEFTFLEVHLDGSDFSATAPFGKTTSTGDESDGPDVRVGSVGDEPSGSRAPLFAAVVGLVFLVVVAALAKKKFGGSSDPVPGLDDDGE